MIWRLIRIIRPVVSKILKKYMVPPPPNLLGDRDIEFSWILANMPDGPGKALDFGAGKSYLGLVAARRGFKVIALDLMAVKWPYKHPDLSFVQNDLFHANLKPNHYDLIINCSAIEHVGLARRYGVKSTNPAGDLEAMKILQGALKPGKQMLLTIPVGRDRVINPIHRIYGQERLPQLLDGWEVVREEYWMKNDKNEWYTVEKSLALEREPSDHYYSLGLFILKR